MEPDTRSDDDVWGMIDKEKRFDRVLRRIAAASWAVVVAILLFRIVLALAHGGLSWNFIFLVWGLCFAVAILSTVGVFLRMRTSSLHEIQLRLHALEKLVASEVGK